MKRKQDSGERRKYPRFYPDEANQPEVSFIFDNGDKVSVDVVNISRGGLFGATTGIEHFMEIDHHRIKMIEIVPPNKEPFRCAGKLLRLYPIRKDNKCFCAVEFYKLGDFTEQEQAEIDAEHEKDVEPDQPVITFSKDDILNRVHKAENYMAIKNAQRATTIRKAVYASFEDITKNLSVEDRWWFFELLDEMKSREPNCPQELKEDFLNLCKIGIDKASQKGKLGLVKE